MTDKGNIPIKLIKNIDLTGNKLTDISEVTELIRVLPHIKICRLDGNQFENVDADFFGSFKKVTSVTLQRNNIKHLPPDLFAQDKVAISYPRIYLIVSCNTLNG